MRRLLTASAVALALAGCASPVDVRSLATGRGDVAVYELNGRDLDALRREAQQLCPLGGDILRQAGRQQRTVPTASPSLDLLPPAAEWIDPSRQTAQLLVQCRESGDRLRLQAAAPAPPPPAPPASAAAARVDLSAALPIGPVLPQW